MYYNRSTIVFIDGEFVNAAENHISLYSQTVQYGIGVFEGIRSYNTNDGVRIFKGKKHFERLLFSADKMGMQINYSAEDLIRYAYMVLEKNNLQDAYIRPIIYMGDSMSLIPNDEVHIAIVAWKWGNYLGDNLLNVCISSFERPNPKSCFVEAKVCGHYTNSILATSEAKRKGFDEALQLDMNGYVAEGPGANFFFEKDGVLVTSPTGHILPGITRATVFELAKELDIEIQERLFKSEELFSADAAFFCGTATEITGIRKIENYEFPLNWEDSVSNLIQRAYKRRVTSNEHKDLYI